MTIEQDGKTILLDKNTVIKYASLLNTSNNDVFTLINNFQPASIAIFLSSVKFTSE